MLALCESTGMRIASALGPRDGFREIHSHFARRMRIGAEGDGDVALLGHLDNLSAGIDFFAILAQARRCSIRWRRCFRAAVVEEALEQRACNPVWGLCRNFLASLRGR